MTDWLSSGSRFHDQLLSALQQLLAIDAVDYTVTFQQAADILTNILGFEKFDIFLFQPAKNALVAMGASRTPMAVRQHELGLDSLPIAGGGRTVETYLTGHGFWTGHAEDDHGDLAAISAELGVRSLVICPMAISGQRRGVLQACSSRAEHLGKRDLEFLESVSHWVGMVIHRTELVERLEREADERGRREATEELLRLLTPRQQEIAALIAAGLTNGQIAERLAISAGSVANHVERILSRLGANRRAQIAAWITEHQAATNNASRLVQFDTNGGG